MKTAFDGYVCDGIAGGLSNMIHVSHPYQIEIFVIIEGCALMSRLI